MNHLSLISVEQHWHNYFKIFDTTQCTIDIHINVYSHLLYLEVHIRVLNILRNNLIG